MDHATGQTCISQYPTNKRQNTYIKLIRYTSDMEDNSIIVYC